MVKCDEFVPDRRGVADNSIISPHKKRMAPPAPLPHQKDYAFRLQDDRLERESAASTSVYSIYKQRIDAMFDETRSQMSSACLTATSHNFGVDHELESRQKRINNSVQARIEKMFADMATNATGGGDGGSGTITSSHFAVDYLGSVSLREKVTSLLGLQQSLSDLYFGYHRRNKHTAWSPPGSLEICSGGLRVVHGGGTAKQEQLNPFPSIAVWAAVKFVYRRAGKEYAFLPLIADPEAVDKGALFRTLPDGLDLPPSKHSPLFAVVMRGTSQKQLECHGFVCACSEDAIVIAANLYQALMTHMQEQKKKPSNKNGISYVSIGGSSVASEANKDIVKYVSDDNAPAQKDGGEVSQKQVDPKHSTNFAQRSSQYNSPSQGISSDDKGPKPEEKIKSTPMKVVPAVPVRPPRKKKSSASSASEDGEDCIQTLTEHKCVSDIKDAQRPADAQQVTGNPRIRRTVSDSHNYNNISVDISGDILTKVAIPRSRSFLNAAGPLTRYGGRRLGARGGESGNHGTNSSGGGSSPLGFNELFTEFRVQEGLDSMDDILDAIIDAEGMSFNDLKPIYKEFLLKLAFTLTKDELYQRSKSIMRRQKKKQNRGVRRKMFHPVGGGLKRVFRRSVSKLKSSKARPSSFEFTSVLFQPNNRTSVRSSKKKKKKNVLSKDSSTSTSSTFSSRNFKACRGPRLARRHSSKRRVGTHHISTRRRQAPLPSTSEDSDFFSMVRTSPPKVNVAQNRSSSGYFSCSECSYDSESCTCTSADKCYCSMGDGPRTRPSAKMTSLSSCGCDTDSCVESDKCYCPRKHHHHHRPSPLLTASKHHLTRSVFDQLRQRGFDPAASPNTARRNEQTQSAKRMDVCYHLPSDFLSYSSSEMALDYDLFRKSPRGIPEEQQKKVLVVSAREPGGRLLYMGASCRSGKQQVSHKKHGSGRNRNRLSVDSKMANEALSVKKSAEIAALFTEVKSGSKASETDEVFYNTLEPPDYYFSPVKTGKNYMGSNLENSLGYLP